MSPRIEFDQRVSYPGLPDERITTRLSFDSPVAFSADPFALTISIEVPSVPLMIQRQQLSGREKIIYEQVIGDGSKYTFILRPPLVPIPVTEVRMLPDDGSLINKATNSDTKTRGHSTNSPYLELNTNDASVVAKAPPGQNIDILFFRAPLD